MIGIYALYWEQEDSYYIGKSSNLEIRERQHLNRLKNNTHSNYKVQNIYNKYGKAKFIIIEECSIELLDLRETYWTNYYNTINNGLNIIAAGGSGGNGVQHSRSKYSKLTILKVFRELYLTTNSFKQISDKTSTTISLVSDICNERTHLWLKEKYNHQYHKMILNKTNRFNIQRGKTGLVKSPEGIEYHISNITEFCRKQNFPNISAAICGFSRLISKNSKSYKNWVLV